MENSEQKAFITIRCTKKEETEDGWSIKLGHQDDSGYLVLNADTKKEADFFIVGREYKCSFRLNNDQDLNPSYLQTVHPGLSYLDAKSLLEFCNENTIYAIGCYGDGSIMYPKWKEEFENKTQAAK